MAANTKMATAIQILCVIAYRGERGADAEIISKSLDTNPVVVRRMLKDMKEYGLVTIKSGKFGGVKLALQPKDITLAQIYRAVEAESGIFALRTTGNPDCPVDQKMTNWLNPIFSTVDRAVENTLRQTTLEDFISELL